eukprot:TRINITY_DN9110_c0_g1_i1.p1 TRINITY_DN9110_c0_g1~~TRINITY_DN9110_c0_g1_i1.p1  ORF type:complete len:131 (+),score=29.52 TRINITY_DN9110_c0_g1_i1:284-676(+)
MVLQPNRAINRLLVSLGVAPQRFQQRWFNKAPANASKADSSNRRTADEESFVPLTLYRELVHTLTPCAHRMDTITNAQLNWPAQWQYVLEHSCTAERGCDPDAWLHHIEPDDIPSSSTGFTAKVAADRDD